MTINHLRQKYWNEFEYPCSSVKENNFFVIQYEKSQKILTDMT